MRLQRIRILIEELIDSMSVITVGKAHPYVLRYNFQTTEYTLVNVHTDDCVLTTYDITVAIKRWMELTPELVTLIPDKDQVTCECECSCYGRDKGEESDHGRPICEVDDTRDS
jgi:hypothetical protein